MVVVLLLLLYDIYPMLCFQAENSALLTMTTTMRNKLLISTATLYTSYNLKIGASSISPIYEPLNKLKYSLFAQMVNLKHI